MTLKCPKNLVRGPSAFTTSGDLESRALFAPVLGEAVQPLDHGGHDGGGGHVDQVLHVLHRLLLAQIQPELVLQQQTKN
jgi:hypothetical protein